MQPILLNLGPVSIYSFGLFLALAFVVGSFYIWREGRGEFDEEILLDLMFLVIIAAVLGARSFYIFSHFEIFDFNPLRWIHFFIYPGFSFWGGIIGGLLAAIWFTKRRKISFWRSADFLVLGVAFGQILGQIGCFLDGCTVGKTTTLPWGQEVMGFLGKRHPVAFYDIFASLLIFLIVLRVYRWIFTQRRQKEGSAALAYLILISLFSFPLEFLKEGGVYLYNLKINQWVALGFFWGAIGLWCRRLRSIRQDLLSIFNFFQQRITGFKKQTTKVVNKDKSEGGNSG